MNNKSERLLKLAKRHAEISNEIRELQSQRGSNLSLCQGSKDPEFESSRVEGENCLTVAYGWVRDDRKKVDGYCDGFAYPTDFSGFDEVIFNYGCINCQSAYEEKKKIGELKQERGRIHSAITKIGQTL